MEQGLEVGQGPLPPPQESCMLSTFWESILWKWKAAEECRQSSDLREQSAGEPVSRAPAEAGRGLGALGIALEGSFSSL